MMGKFLEEGCKFGMQIPASSRLGGTAGLKGRKTEPRLARRP